MSQRKHRRLVLLAVALLWAEDCERSSYLPAPGGGAPRRDDSVQRIRERGALRVLAPRRDGEAFLPRNGSPLEVERELAEAFARDLGLTTFIVTRRFGQVDIEGNTINNIKIVRRESRI